MQFAALLRASLVPLGVAIAHKGIAYLTEQAEAKEERARELDAAIAAREAYLAGEGPKPEPLDDEPEPELENCLQDDKQSPGNGPGNYLHDGKQISSSAAASGTAPAKLPALAMLAGVAAGIAAGAYAAHRGRRWLEDRALAELAADVDPARWSNVGDLLVAAAAAEPADRFTAHRRRSAAPAADVDEDQGDAEPADDEHACRWCDYAPPLTHAGPDRNLQAILHRNDCPHRPAGYGVRR